ncbi:unnamed protein product [Nesidiocoris tenuis]|uniref:BZIP domain-containing protein n=1 Tax=Nesidiocoris tenuis TaxID=355587 RepID=A0A6H5G0V8_9HEMI|nr:unnamed protein product [Nesidiocoris tenuis]
MVLRSVVESTMEQTLYDDLCVNMNREQMKRSLTLDFGGKASANSKRAKLMIESPTVLNSPDVNMVKLSSPELEKFILNNADLTTTPTPTSFCFPKHVTQEQESFSQGFVAALNELHNSDSSQGASAMPAVSESSRAASNYVTLDAHYGGGGGYPFSLSSSSPGGSSVADITVKDEPQTVPNSSPPVSPIDMESQERYKLERKRLRNRVAASKCRKKKLERIAHLEIKVKNLKGENSELSLVVNKLRDEVCRLKQQVITHMRRGCKIAHPGSSPTLL